MNGEEPQAGCAASMGAVRPGGRYCSFYREGQILGRHGPRRCYRSSRHGKFQHARRPDRRGLCALATENGRIGSGGIFRLILDGDFLDLSCSTNHNAHGSIRARPGHLDLPSLLLVPCARHVGQTIQRDIPCPFGVPSKVVFLKKPLTTFINLDRFVRVIRYAVAA
jgi:hypothetical protein